MNVSSASSVLENTVLNRTLAGDLPKLSMLRAQVGAARVQHREWTGAGFRTEFAVPGSAPRLGNRNRFQITGVYGRHPALEAGVGFALHVEDGMVRSLEGYTYEEPWPNDLEQLEIEQEPVGEQRLADLAAAVRGQR